MSVQTIHFLIPPPPKRSTQQHFLSAKNPHENNKNQAKKLKVYGKNVDFHSPPSPRKYMFCTLMKMLTFMDGPLVISTTLTRLPQIYLSLQSKHLMNCLISNNTKHNYKIRNASSLLRSTKARTECYHHSFSILCPKLHSQKK